MKATYTSLKDPYTYWDVQGRRNYGEIIHDQDMFTDIWGIGPEQSPSFGLKLLAQAAAFVGLVCFGVWVWNPEQHSIRVRYSIYCAKYSPMTYFSLSHVISSRSRNIRLMVCESNLEAIQRMQTTIFIPLFNIKSKVTFHFSVRSPFLVL
jgi:hypothetical protein